MNREIKRGEKVEEEMSGREREGESEVMNLEREKREGNKKKRE